MFSFLLHHHHDAPVCRLVSLGRARVHHGGRWCAILGPIWEQHHGIRPEWWDGLARMIMDYQTEPFSKVVGIPRGGMALAYAMEKYVTPGDHPWMVVDDVFAKPQQSPDLNPILNRFVANATKPLQEMG